MKINSKTITQADNKQGIVKSIHDLSLEMRVKLVHLDKLIELGIVSVLKIEHGPDELILTKTDYRTNIDIDWYNKLCGLAEEHGATVDEIDSRDDNFDVSITISDGRRPYMLWANHEMLIIDE